jgi:predicted protein tyrosine phosphatase
MLMVGTASPLRQMLCTMDVLQQANGSQANWVTIKAFAPTLQSKVLQRFDCEHHLSIRVNDVDANDAGGMCAAAQ